MSQEIVQAADASDDLIQDGAWAQQELGLKSSNGNLDERAFFGHEAQLS